jgi:hypothetical protein
MPLVLSGGSGAKLRAEDKLGPLSRVIYVDEVGFTLLHLLVWRLPVSRRVWNIDMDTIIHINSCQDNAVVICIFNCVGFFKQRHPFENRGRQGSIMLTGVTAFDVTVTTISELCCFFKYIVEVDVEVVLPHHPKEIGRQPQGVAAAALVVAAIVSSSYSVPSLIDDASNVDGVWKAICNDEAASSTTGGGVSSTAATVIVCCGVLSTVGVGVGGGGGSAIVGEVTKCC